MSTIVPAIIEVQLRDETSPLNELHLVLRLLYEAGIILESPRELMRRVTRPGTVEMLVTFVDEAASEQWPLDSVVQEDVMPRLLEVSTGAFLTIPLRPDGLQPRVCACDRWEALLLSGQAHTRMCPLVCCSCWGFVPGYRAPLYDELERWGQANARVEQLWFDSSTLARWAGDHLADYQSTLNRKARKLVNELRKATGVPVYFRIFVRSDGPARSCPNCGSDGKPSGWRVEYRLGKRCKLAFR